VKAVMVSEFGAPSVLKLAEVPKPRPDRPRARSGQGGGRWSVGRLDPRR
jgi:hypothetical protein